MNIGSASILLVFVILCLVSFAVLSIVSANADSRLSTRVLERTTAYYDACNQADDPEYRAKTGSCTWAKQNRADDNGNQRQRDRDRPDADTACNGLHLLLSLRILSDATQLYLTALHNYSAQLACICSPCFTKILGNP